MKKNLLGAIVIFFVTLAFLLVIDGLSKDNQKQQPTMVIIDQE